MVSPVPPCGFPGADLILSMRHVLVASCTPPNGMGDAKQVGVAEMPTLRWFDEEFGQDAVAIFPAGKAS